MTATLDLGPHVQMAKSSHRTTKAFVVSRKTSGYCWPTSFKVLGVLFLGEVCAAFLPLKKACWVRQFRYLRVGQQYPLVFCTRDERGNAAGITCTETSS